MQFTAATFALLATATSVCAQTVITPTPGQVLSASEPFNLTFASQRIFKESSNKIDVVISSLGGGFPGAAPVRDLAPTAFASDTSAIYSVMVNPIALCCGGVAGNRTIYVLEDYNAFGGLPGLDEIAVPVTFV
ncbi:hypothetical protein B0H14DRAFT_2700395 [Mycena olivaceomarginata]|uniref:Uncharacterized protein n=1 Tax=Mycena albidolilacea TaxID=1033008 RepID=A0AAD7E8V7_9AGAR|nr:hypothetical protein DFH08DRAFT_904139 [Mycena albidolilacea]KAJ7884573.1 hypothetical protein B0H14DRAFT_2700395 [Mycena olivaceomarginata]